MGPRCSPPSSGCYLSAMWHLLYLSPPSTDVHCHGRHKLPTAARGLRLLTTTSPRWSRRKVSRGGSVTYAHAEPVRFFAGDPGASTNVLRFRYVPPALESGAAVHMLQGNTAAHLHTMPPTGTIVRPTSLLRTRLNTSAQRTLAIHCPLQADDGCVSMRYSDRGHRPRCHS